MAIRTQALALLVANRCVIEMREFRNWLEIHLIMITTKIQPLKCGLFSNFPAGRLRCWLWPCSTSGVRRQQRQNSCKHRNDKL